MNTMVFLLLIFLLQLYCDLEFSVLFSPTMPYVNAHGSMHEIGVACPAYSHLWGMLDRVKSSIRLVRSGWARLALMSLGKEYNGNESIKIKKISLYAHGL